MAKTSPKQKTEPPPEAIRFRQFREAKKISRDKLATALGVHRNTIQKYESGDRKLPLRFIDRAAPLIGTTSREVLSQPGIDQGETVSIPECSVRVLQTGGIEMNDANSKDVWILPRRYLMDELKIPPGRLIIHEVKSDSMSPTLESGDRVLVNLEDTFIDDGGVFLIMGPGKQTVRRLEPILGSKPLLMTVCFDRDRAKAQELRANEIKVIGRVVWYARRL